MNQDLSKKIMCISIRGGVEIWAEEDKIANLKKVLMSTSQSKFVQLDDEVINTADITGIFGPATMEEVTMRKNGYWKCKWNFWHKKFDDCAHGKQYWDKGGCA
jgi:hypothetical protein